MSLCLQKYISVGELSKHTHTFLAEIICYIFLFQFASFLYERARFFIFLTHTIVEKTDIFTPAYRLQTNKWVKEYIESTRFFVCIIFFLFFVFVRCPYNLRETFVLIRQFLTFVISCFLLSFLFIYFGVFVYVYLYFLF